MPKQHTSISFSNNPVVVTEPETKKHLFLSFNKDLVVEKTNAALEKFYGLSKQEVMSKGIEIFVKEKELYALLSQKKDLLTQSKNNECCITVESRQTKRTKRYLIIWTILVILDGKNNHDKIILSGILLSQQDIYHKVAEDNYFALESMIAHLPGNIYWMDKNCVHLGCNNNVLNLLGITREQYIGTTYEDLVTIGCLNKDHAISFKKDDLSVINTGKPKFNVEEPPVSHIDGRTLYFLTSRVPIRNKMGEIVGVAGISIDITERKSMERDLQVALEKAELANKAKNDFIANMSHDIRTPLTGLGGMARIIAKEATTETVKDSAHSMIKAADILLDLLNKIIEFSKLESGELPIYDVKFSMKELVNNITALVTPAALEKNLKIIVHYDKKIPKYLIGDSIRVERILLNLMGNAIKFTLKGTIEIFVNFAKNEDKQVVLKIMIKDTGIGIPKEKQEIIYSKFDKLNPSYTGIYKGYGLGLSIVKQFITEIEGEIYVKSKENEGTTFTCIIPFKEPLLDEAENVFALLQTDFEHDSATVSPENKRLTRQSKKTQEINQFKSNEKNKANRNYKILLVEDNDLAQQIAKYQLKSLGCDVEIADTGEKAIKLVRKNRYDLIFMDIGLPGKDGIQTTIEIRKLEANKNRHTPIIALTAHIDRDNKEKCLRSGMDDVLTKPLYAQKTQEVLKEYIKLENIEQNVYNVSPQTMDESIKTIDIEFSQNFLRQTKESAIEMLKMLVKSLPGVKHDLEQAYQKHNWKQFKFDIHKFYGGLHYCGALRLKEATKQLEKILEESNEKNRNIPIIDKLYTQLINEMQRLEKEFKKFH